MNCKKCGSEVEQGQTFCSFCGAKIDWDSAKQASGGVQQYASGTDDGFFDEQPAAPSATVGAPTAPVQQAQQYQQYGAVGNMAPGYNGGSGIHSNISDFHANRNLQTVMAMSVFLLILSVVRVVTAFMGLGDIIALKEGGPYITELQSPINFFSALGYVELVFICLLAVASVLFLITTINAKKSNVFPLQDASNVKKIKQSRTAGLVMVLLFVLFLVVEGLIAYKYFQIAQIIKDIGGKLGKNTTLLGSLVVSVAMFVVCINCVYNLGRVYKSIPVGETNAQ